MPSRKKKERAREFEGILKRKRGHEDDSGDARKIGALFTDYDGTIAPADVSRSKSRVPEPILSKLVELSSRIPIAIITSKDYRFIRPRTVAFARAWACASGLDLKLRANGKDEEKKGSLPEPRKTPDIRPSLRRVETELPRGIVIERKRASDKDRTLLGFAIDWTTGPTLTRSDVSLISRRLEDEGLYVSHSPGQTFLDAFAVKPSKGVALRILAKQLGVSGSTVAYLGDSDTDNAAFDRAGISIGIDHGQPVETLRSRYLMAFDDVGAFLGSLSENDLRFGPEASALLTENPRAKTLHGSSSRRAMAQ